MSESLPLIEGRDKLIALFGVWPSFHDAEVIDLHYWRGDVLPGDWDDRNVFPILTVKLRILQATQVRSAGGSEPDIFTTIRFHDVADFEMDGFNHVNQIVKFSIRTEERGHLQHYLRIVFERGFGMHASFRCFRVEVLEATPVANVG